MSQNSRLRLVWIGVVALLTAGVVAGIAIMTATLPTRLPSILPEDTVVLFSHVHREDLRLYENILPTLQSVPAVEGLMSVGVVKTSAGTYDWALALEEEGAVFPPSVQTVSVRRQSVAVSNQSLESLLTEHEHPLSGFQPFRSTVGSLQSSPFIYANTVEVPSLLTLTSTRLGTLARDLLGTPGEIALFPRAGGMMIRVFELPSGQPQALSAPPELPTLSPAPIVSLASSAPLKTLQSALGLSDGTTEIAEGTLAAMLRKTLGDEVSVRFDLVPLIMSPASISLGPSVADGTRTFVVEGSTNDDDLWDRTTRRLHTAVRLRGDAGIVEGHLLEGEYDYTILKADSAVPETTESTIGSWHVRQTLTKGSGGLITARSRNRYIAGNDLTWVRQALARETGKVALPSTLGFPVFAGSMATPSFLSLVAPSGDTNLLPASIRAALGESGTVFWTVSRMQGVTQVNLERRD